jgi:hypothetical protein
MMTGNATIMQIVWLSEKFHLYSLYRMQRVAHITFRSAACRGRILSGKGVSLMDTNRATLASIIGGVLLVLFMLPISMGGVGGTLFWIVFGVLVLYLIATIIFAIVHRRQLH